MTRLLEIFRQINNPRKALKLQDVKMTDQLAGHKNAGHENQGMKL